MSPAHVPGWPEQKRAKAALVDEWLSPCWWKTRRWTQSGILAQSRCARWFEHRPSLDAQIWEAVPGGRARRSFPLPWCTAGGPTCSHASKRQFRKRWLLGLSRIYYLAVLVPSLSNLCLNLLLRWDGVTAHPVFNGLPSAMPPEEDCHLHQWKRDNVIAALRDHRKFLAAGNLVWGGNPLQSLTVSAELLCWKEAAISVFVCV